VDQDRLLCPLPARHTTLSKVPLLGARGRGSLTLTLALGREVARLESAKVAIAVLQIANFGFQDSGIGPAASAVSEALPPGDAWPNWAASSSRLSPSSGCPAIPYNSARTVRKNGTTKLDPVAR
jgi:hypothetical protein